MFGTVIIDAYRKEESIGLAGDLAERFKQHNGILPVKEGSKQAKIEEYFSKNETLGYTIFVQSPLSQPLLHRN